MNDCNVKNKQINKPITPDGIYSQIYSFNKNKFDYDNWIRQARIQGGLSIYFFKTLVFQIKYSKKLSCHYLAIPNDYLSYFTSDLFTSMPPVKNWSRFLIRDELALNHFKDPFSELYSFLESDYSVNNEFGCCHLYDECSDEKKCVQDNVLFSNRCYYKKNLNNGLIFYGRNRNV